MLERCGEKRDEKRSLMEEIQIVQPLGKSGFFFYSLLSLAPRTPGTTTNHSSSSTE